MATFKGIAFPFQKGPTAFPEKAEDSDLIRQSIIQIVMTQRGERVMRPDFGSGVMRYVFENNDELLEQQIRTEVFASVARHEPRAIIQAVSVDQEDNEVIISISFVIRATRQQDRLVVAIPTPAP